MQDYKLFIDEINNLDIRTKQLFVKDGVVLDEEYHNPKWYANAPDERKPGYLSTFYNFDHYNDQLDVDNYNSLLIRLRERALSDIFLLTSDQIDRIVAVLKIKRDRMINLVKLSGELVMAFRNQTFGDVSRLEYNLFNAFTIISRPQASFEERSANYLMDAIVAKRTNLIVLIKHLEPPIEEKDDPHVIEKVSSKIFIVAKAKQILIDALSPFTDESQRTTLEHLIFEGKESTIRIQHHCQQNTLAYVFFQLEQAQLLTGTQTSIAEWICANFSPATYDTIYDVIRGNKQPAKNKRIKIKI